jgi:hypothetical protein
MQRGNDAGMNGYRYFLTLLALFIVAGCGSTSPQVQSRTTPEPSVSVHADSESISIEELDQLTYAFADRYYVIVSSAIDAIKRGNSNPEQRRIAHRIKVNGVIAINDIVSGNDPYSKTLDLLVSVTLQSNVWIDEDRAETVFGERAPILISALHQAREDAWDLAARVLNQEQLELLELLIREWRRKHPQIDQVEFVKFDNFAGARAAWLLNELKAGGGLLAPLRETAQELREYRRMAERAFWYSKRAPSIAGIQMEEATNEILAAPEVGQLLQVLDNWSHAVGQVGKTVEALPSIIESERKALFAEVDKRKDEINVLIENVQTLVRDVNQLAQTMQTTLTKLSETMQIADSIAGRYYDPNAPKTPTKPFDINEYTPVVTKLNEIIVGLNELTRSADLLTRSEGWRQGLLDISKFTDCRIDRISRNVYLAIGLIFLVTVIYRILSILIVRRPKHSKIQSESAP